VSALPLHGTDRLEAAHIPPVIICQCCDFVATPAMGLGFQGETVEVEQSVRGGGKEPQRTAGEIVDRANQATNAKKEANPPKNGGE